MSNDNDELPEDLVVMTPGQMLKEAREKNGLSVENIAKRLNLRASLISEIENDELENKNTTFVRGYLKAYAKLVGLSEQDVLDGLAHLNCAHQLSVELQSFSNETKNKSSDSRLMAFTYLAITLLLVSMVIWWSQQNESDSIDPISQVTEQTEPKVAQFAPGEKISLLMPNSEKKAESGDGKIPSVNPQSVKESPEDKTESEQQSTENSTQALEPKKAETADLSVENKDEAKDLASLEFRFERRIWVQVKDASGDKIAYGTKAAGRVMTLKGKPPFKVILGTTAGLILRYNGKLVDLGRFDTSKFAKFQLPL